MKWILALLCALAFCLAMSPAAPARAVADEGESEEVAEDELTGIQRFLDRWIFHLDERVEQLTAPPPNGIGEWMYVVLFAIIFCETGLVVTPFLPGDSLLFMSGAAAAASGGNLNVGLLWLILLIAAVGGDTVNYHIGHFIGPKVLRFENSWWLNKRHLDSTHAFFEKYGPITVILSRFLPMFRTFTPFVAGVGAMSYRKFIIYNFTGGFIWVSLFVWGGFFFGKWKVVKDNFFLVILVMVGLSLIPWFLGVGRHYWLKRAAAKALPETK